MGHVGVCKGRHAAGMRSYVRCAPAIWQRSRLREAETTDDTLVGLLAYEAAIARRIVAAVRLQEDLPERKRLRAQQRPLNRGVECRHLDLILLAQAADPVHDACVLESIDIDFSIKRQVVLIYAKRGHGQLRSSTDVGGPRRRQHDQPIITNSPRIAS